MKRCFKCGETKPLDEFYRHKRMRDGHLGKCKECAKRDVRQNRVANHDYYIAYDRARMNRDDRVLARQEYAATERGKEAQRRGVRAWARRNPEKRAAQSAVGNAIRDGRLKRQPCEVCGKKAQAHHDDYSRPLDVRWLCSLHHSRRHVELRLAANRGGPETDSRLLSFYSDTEEALRHE